MESLPATDKDQDITPITHLNVSNQNHSTDQICYQRGHEGNAKTGCPGFHRYCIMPLGIDHCRTILYFLMKTRIYQWYIQEVNFIKSSHRPDMISNAKGRKWTKLARNSIIIANRFSIFRKHYHYWLLFSKKWHVILSLMSITSILTRTSCMHACRAHHYQTHFHTRTQTQPKRATAIQLARFDFFKRDYVWPVQTRLCLLRRHWMATPSSLCLTDGARWSKKLKCETVLVW
jgi:hypothetical protein